MLRALIYKRSIIILILLIACIAVTDVSAADNFTNDSYTADSIDTLKMEEIDDSLDEEKLSSPFSTFTDLNNIVNDESKWTINLDRDYSFSPNEDSNLVNGIVINRSITINGNGHTINANNQSRIFNVTNYVNFNNIVFRNAYADSGAAITGSNYAVSNCKFISNDATSYGGAMLGGYAKDSVFEDNSAEYWGGAVYNSNIDNCSFVRNSAKEGGAMYNSYATSSTFMYNSANYGGAMSLGSTDNSIFISNIATNYGGAAFNSYVVNCNFTRNSALSGGALGGGGYSAVNSLFEYNSATSGGAMLNGTASHCTFFQNSAENGGAKYLGSAVDCIFNDNRATKQGGAIKDTYVVNCNLTYNTAPQGGAMALNSAVNSLFMFNTADYGGAMYSSYSDTCEFYNNSAKQGGAIYSSGANSSDFGFNHAVNGGAAALSDVFASVFISNLADENGGANYQCSARRSLFLENKAKFGGAIEGGSASECTFRNNVAKISGGTKFNASVFDSEFEGNLPNYNLYVSNFTGIEGFGGNINIKMYDSPNYPVTGVNSIIKVYNSKNMLIGTYISEVGYNWFVDFKTGKYKAIIDVNDPVYEIDPLKVSITIQKSSSIFAANVVTSYQAGKFLIVNLHDSSGNVIKYAKISVTLNGVTKSYVTDDNGQVMVPTKSLAPAIYVATIKYAGDATYLKTSTTAKITVKKVNPKIIAAKKTFKFKDKTKKYTVTLKNNKNAIIKSGKVTISVGGKTYSATTNSKGIATFKLTKLTKKGIFSAVIKFSGNKYYNAIKKTVKLTVKK